MLDLIIITLLICLFTNWLQLKPFFWKNAGIPYSIPLPFVGSVGRIFFTPFRTLFTSIFEKMGDNPMYGFHYFDMPALVLADADLIKTVTINEADKFMKRGIHSDETYDPMGKGVFFSSGEQWKTFRGKMTPYFTPSRVKSMLPLIHPIGEKFTEYIIRESKSGPVDVHGASMKMAVDIVASTVFGLQPDAFDDPNSFFLSLQKELISFMFGFKIFLGTMSPKLYRLLGLTILSGETTKRMKQFVDDVIDQRQNGIGNRMDFIQGMVDLMGTEKADDERQMEFYNDGTSIAKFDRYSVTGQCMIMYLAGTETTGNTLGFLLYELALNQTIQQTAREEILAMITRTNNKYTYDDLNGLRYVQMILKETLRKHPVVIAYTRQCTKAFKLNGIEIPVGTMVFIAPIALHHDERFFSEPEKFIPERFEEDQTAAGTYAPFGMGPRTCIGVKFAQMDIILALCKLLSKCRLSISDRTEVPLKYNYNPTLHPNNGVWLNIEEIN